MSGICATGPLKSCYIQSENDDGDLCELRDGILKGLQFSESDRELPFQMFNS